MKIAFGADHAGYKMKQAVLEYVRDGLKCEVVDFGTNSGESCDYPDFAFAAAKAVASGECDFGILVCGSGIGMEITANKVEGIRAADCLTVEMGELCRRHNNANVLTLGERLISVELAKMIATAFLETKFEGGRHERRVNKIHELTGL